MTQSRLVYCLGLTALAVAALPRPASAQRSWDGGNATFFWGDNGNWSPDGSPSGVAVSVGNLAVAANDTTLLDASYSISSLTITNGADVINSTDNGATTEFELLVNGPTTVSGAGSSITVYGGAPDGLDTATLTLNNGGTLNLNSQEAVGTAVVESDSGAITNNVGGTIFGNGRIDLEAAPGVVTTLLNNEGTLTAGSFGLIIFNPPLTTLHITATSANARIDLDGAVGGNGVVNVNRNATLDVDVPLSDAFSGVINLGSGATLDVASPWSIGSGVVNVNTSGFIVGSGGPAAHLVGGAITFNSGTLALDDIDSLVLDAALTSTGGAINNSGSITVNSTSTIGAGTDFNMVGGLAKLTVNGTLNIDTPDFNLDGSEAVGNVTTINAGGHLDLDLGVGADLSYGHTINMNGGELDVTTSAATAWTLNPNGTINAAGGATSTVNSAGETFQIQGDVNVTGNSTLVVNSTSEFAGTADVVIDSGSALNMAATAYNGGNYSGGGTLRKGTATIDAATTWNVAQVDLDDGATTLNANLTINANTVEPDSDGVDNTHTINDARLLTVNIAGGGGWTLDAGGTIAYNGNASAESYLAGSDIAMNGTINHTGDGRIDARMEIGSSGVVNILTAAQPLRLSGGNNTTNPNTIAGGAINGPGLLGADAGAALHGSGTISADVDFDGSANLKADNGVMSLTVGTAIVDVNEIGTADADGVLAVGSPWNTNVAARVRLAGGEVRGAAITNDGIGGIAGFGLLSSQTINTTHIDADGGLLIVQTPGNNNDWDGAGNAGSLNATTGNLELRDNAAFLFNGSVQAAGGHEAFANGFELEFQPASSLTLNNGRFRSTNTTNFGGTTTVGAGNSEIALGGAAVFEAASATTINGTLRLNNPVTQINAGATFAGGGALVNVGGGNILRLEDGADVDVFVENQAMLLVGSAVAAQATGLDYQQNPAGLWKLDLNGTALNQFDRLSLTGAAQLNGTLDIDLGGGYVPALGDTFGVLSAVGGVTGTFSSVLEPAGLPAGLLFDVVYQPTLVQLVVVNAPMFSADFDSDGDVDSADLVQWQGDYGINGDSNADNDGDSDGADFLAWQQQLGSPAVVAATHSVPEPATAVLLAASAALAVGGRRRIR
jgi:hypothetical protein